MCGIFGHTMQADSSLPASRKALHSLKHRGPDQWNDWSDSQVYLGHRRLSIMDLSANGRQPMVDDSGTILVTVNGEIYNYQSLKQELQQTYTFKSGSDSEVLLYGYREWGMETLLSKIEGMFAFTLYDKARHKLFLVRDRVGIKPLYYALTNNQLAWASELKALVQYYEASLEVDYTAVYDYLTYIYIPAPKTLYKNVFKLEPAQYLEFDLTTQTLAKQKYWHLAVVTTDITPAKAAAKVSSLVHQAVKDQLMSDVPVGFFLSGGMDSSTVVAVAASYSQQLHTYSIGFDTKEHDETHFATLVAQKFNTNHTRQEVSVLEVKKLLSHIKTWYDEPFADTSAFPVYLVSQLAKATSTVVLTGDGGDEVFGGYNWYTQFKDSVDEYVRTARKNLPPTKRWLGGLTAKKSTITWELEYYTSLMGGLSAAAKLAYKKKFNIPADYDDVWYFRNYYRPELPLLTRLQYLDFHTYLPDDILTKVDRASMAVALECRVPLLSTNLIEFMFSVPESVKFPGGELKGLMKQAFKHELPSAIIERDKKGFSIPTGKWKSQLMSEKSTMPEFILNSFYEEL